MDAHQDSAGGESNRTKTEAEELIAELCIKCDDDDVKQVLKKYQYGYSIPDIEKRMKQGPASNLPHLIKALKFLNNTAIPDKIPTRKDVVTHRIVCGMQNLLPDDCLSAKHASNHSMMKNPYFNAQSVAKTAIEAASLDC